MSIMYNFLIQPLVVVYDLLYSVLYGILDDAVLSIIALSIVINLIVLPLYRKADQMQREQLEKETKMQPVLTHIRKHFYGDERFMMQAAYYRIEHYNPLSVLKEAGPLLLQIPFFIAAYRYISNIPMLGSTSLGGIKDLLSPDGLLKIGGISINILPILMTYINCVSGYIYSKGAPLRQKIQIYGIAGIFLVLLYDSASGLVIYWIMNQLFSLLKNYYSVKKIKNKDILLFFTGVISLLVLEFGFVYGIFDTAIELTIALCLAIACVGIIVRSVWHILKWKKPKCILELPDFMKPVGEELTLAHVITIEMCLAVFMGIYIPSSILSSSVIDFVDSATGNFPYVLISYPALIYAGLFVVWMTVIVFSRGQRNIVMGLWIFLGIGLVNHFLFDPHVGILYSSLLFDGKIDAGGMRTWLNTLACIAVGSGFFLLYTKKPQWVKRIAIVLSITFAVISTGNLMTIKSTIQTLPANPIQANDEKDKVLKLSKNGKNVIVFMLDRAIGGYVPYIFDENPVLKNKFQGFICYENTLSFGRNTNHGSPAVFGGYEYTPAEMNKRDTVLLKDKHNEALKLMPALFSKKGYHITVCDVPYGNYMQMTDLSIFDEYPNTETYLIQGKYVSELQFALRDAGLNQQHNFVIYSLFRMAPLFLKESIYDDGSYLSLKTAKNSYSKDFLEQYSELVALPEITDVSAKDGNCFLMMYNYTPHEPVALNPPDYAVDGSEAGFNRSSKVCDGRTMNFPQSMSWASYCANAASYQAIGEWLDYLRKNGVYDNTRIIFVADHGYWQLHQFDELLRDDGLDVEAFWPMLMVKDFDDSQPFRTSMEFMTNADVPTIAMEGLIENPINPFTGQDINNEAKNGTLYVTDGPNWDIASNNGTMFNDENANWWSVHDSMLDVDNWEKLNRDERG